jgi:hypothetical protein
MARAWPLGAPRSKYGAEPIIVDGVRFASKKEARRYGELKLLARLGKIDGLIVQPKYRLLILPFLGRERVSVGEYIGDFQYVEHGAIVVEDVKGVRTPVYRLKKRLVEALYGISIREI